MIPAVIALSVLMVVVIVATMLRAIKGSSPHADLMISVYEGSGILRKANCENPVAASTEKGVDGHPMTSA